MVRSPLIPIVLAGPTASGKSGLALSWAERFDGEIICADSRQFYRGMRIGTAGPNDEECARVPHHGYAMLDPLQEKMDAGAFVTFARATIVEIQSRKKRPILVGGTGLYLRSLRYGLGSIPPSNKSMVKELEHRCDEEGLQALYEQLFVLDPESAKAIQPLDRYRIIRALEICQTTGVAPSQLRTSFLLDRPQINAHWIYKKPERSFLQRAIATRVRSMFDEGLIDEAVALRNRLPPNHWALNVMGYQEALGVFDGHYDREAAIERCIIRHRQYAKRQYGWFNKEPFYRFKV